MFGKQVCSISVMQKITRKTKIGGKEYEKHL